MQAKNERNARNVEDGQDPGQEIEIVVVALVPDPGLVTVIGVAVTSTVLVPGIEIVGDLVHVLEIITAEDDPGPDPVTMNVDQKPDKDHLQQRRKN